MPLEVPVTSTLRIVMPTTVGQRMLTVNVRTFGDLPTMLAYASSHGVHRAIREIQGCHSDCSASLAGQPGLRGDNDSSGRERGWNRSVDGDALLREQRRIVRRGC